MSKHMNLNLKEYGPSNIYFNLLVIFFIAFSIVVLIKFDLEADINLDYRKIMCLYSQKSHIEIRLVDRLSKLLKFILELKKDQLDDQANISCFLEP